MHNNAGHCIAQMRNGEGGRLVTAWSSSAEAAFVFTHKAARKRWNVQIQIQLQTQIKYKYIKHLNQNDLKKMNSALKP